MYIEIGGGSYHHHHNDHYDNRSYNRKSITSPKGLILMGILALVVTGIVFAVFYNRIFGYSNYIEKEAVVVDLYESYDYEDGTYTYASIAEFEVDGHKYLVKDDVSSSIPDPIGKIVVIKYNPSDPHDAMFKQSSNTVVFLITIIAIFGISAIVMIITGLVKLKQGETSI